MLSESDWELINAYADGELPPAGMAEVRRRLAAEPALAASMAEVRSTKSRLAALRPAASPDLPSPAPRAPRARRRIAAAACLAALVALGAAYQLLWRAPSWIESPAELHRILASKTYVLPERQALPVISTARIGDMRVFDLSSSRLFLVDVQSSRQAGRDVVAMHYRGLRGCRLTVVAVEAMTGDPAALPVRHEGLGARWTAGPIHFYLLASGMDRNRFDAIATYARSESLRLNDDAELRVAMREATAQARPCA